MEVLEFRFICSVVLFIAFLSWDVSAKEVPYTLEDRACLDENQGIG